MLRKESEVVSEGNGPVPQREEFGSGQPTLEEVCRMSKKTLKSVTGDLMRCKNMWKIREVWISV